MSTEAEERIPLQGEGCAECSWKERIRDVKEIKKGDHISIPGSTCCFGLFYDHHAIVEDVEQESYESTKIKVIENNTNGIQSNERTLTNRERAWIVRYPGKSYPASERLRIAQEELEKPKEKKSAYSLPTYNCEHFCNHICVGKKQSDQVNNCFVRLSRFTIFGLNMLKVIYMTFFVIMLSANDLLFYLKEEYRVEELEAVSFVILGVIILGYLNYCVLKYIGYSFCLPEPICKNCKCCKWKFCERRITKCTVCLAYSRRVLIPRFIALCICEGTTVGISFLLKAKFSEFSISKRLLIKACIESGCSILTVIIFICIPYIVWYPHLRKKQKESD